MSSATLMPFALSTGWAVLFNAFYDLSITPMICEWFDEDLLWLMRVHLDADRVMRDVGDIDLGWYPSEALDGSYRLRLLGRDGWDEILIDITSRDRNVIAQAITLCSQTPLENQQVAREFFATQWRDRFGTQPSFAQTSEEQNS